MERLEHYHPAPIAKEQQNTLLSVIVTAYNIEDYIERGVRSVCAQTYQKLEIIVVDDGSTDQTGRICDELAVQDDRIRVLHKKNGGPSEARNEGMRLAAGEVIGFVDGDDWIDPDMYEKLFSAMTEQEAELAVCRYRQVYRDHTEDASQELAVCFEGQEALASYVKEEKEYAIQNAAWNKLYRRELLEGITFPEGKWYEDILFATAVLARAERCIYLDTALYNYIIDREGSIMNTQINPRTFTDQIPAYYEKTEFLKKIGREDLADIHDYFFYKRLLQFYDRLGKTAEAEQTAYREEVADILQRDAERVKKAFSCPAAEKREYRRAALFFRSRRCYQCSVRWEEQVVLPLKIWGKRLLQRG